jgi:hypothetical protein
MGAGVPVLVSRTGSFEELPDNAVGKVDVGEIEEDLLLEYLLLLARRPDVRAAMSDAARHYVAQRHTLEGAARGYLEFIAGLTPGAHYVQVQSSKLAFERNEFAEAKKGFKVQSLGRDNVRDGAFPPQQIMEGASNPNPTDPLLASLVEAVAELGIEENDDAILESIAHSIAGILRTED